MRGTIVIDNKSGRALRKKPASVRSADVLHCAGGFGSGDAVYIAFRTLDGSQYVLATGIALFDEAALRKIVSTAPSSLRDPSDASSSDVVVREQDIRLLWPTR